MKLYIDNPKAFAKAYAGIAGVKSTRSKIGVADAILVRAKKGVVLLASATDKVTAVAYPDGCQDSTDGVLLLPRDRFLAILRAQEKVKDGYLTLEVAEDEKVGRHVKVTTSNGLFTLEKLDPDAYPALIKMGNPPAIEMSLGDLKHIVALARFADPDSTRYALDSICVRLDRPNGREFRLTACATDARRLGVVTLAVTTDSGNADDFKLPTPTEGSPGILIPEHYIAQAAGLFSGLFSEDAIASISFPETRDGGHVCRIACRAEGGSKPPTVMVFPLGQGRFPRWESIYPNKGFHAYRIAFESAQVVQAAYEHVMAVGDKDSTNVDIEVIGEEVYLHAIEGHEGAGVVLVPGGYEVKSILHTTRFDLPIAPALLRDALRFFPPDCSITIDLFCNPERPRDSQPVVLNGSCREHVLMPLMCDDEYLLRRRLMIESAMTPIPS